MSLTEQHNFNGSGIYEIRCTKTGKRYIGSAVKVNDRRRIHLYHLRHGTHHSPRLQNAWNRHGCDAFAFRLLEAVSDVQSLIVREQWWLDSVRPELNIRAVAESQLGTKRTPEQRAAMCKAQLAAAAHRVIWNKGKRGVLSPETIQKIREARARQVMPKGRAFTPEHRAKLAEAKRGKPRPPRSKEHRRKLSEALTGQKWPEERREAASAARKGKRQSPRSAEHRQRLSEAKKLYWEKRREQQSAA